MPASLLFNNASIYNAENEAVPNDVFMRILEDLPESGPDTVATRFGVVIGARPAVPEPTNDRSGLIRKASLQRVSDFISANKPKPDQTNWSNIISRAGQS
jgi:hypothetical protein